MTSGVEPYESLAERIVRVASSLKEIPRQELVAGVVERDSLATGLAGALGVTEAVPELTRQLKGSHFSSYDYNKVLIALEELNVRELAPYIEQHFLQGQTRAAATIALMRLAPARAVSSFMYYGKHADEGGAVLAVGLRQLYEKDRAAMLEALQYIPTELLRRTIRHLPEEVTKELAPYT